MKRALALAAVVAAGVFVFAAVDATARDNRKSDPGSIHVIEHATTDAVTNGSSADAAGNVLTFANDVFDSADARRSAATRATASESPSARRGSATGPPS
jgi:hypothetical protein